MNLGIEGKSALVCAASKGLGKACAMSLAREGARVTITARGKEALEAAAAEIRDVTGAAVATVAGDIGTEQGRAAALAACPAPDILVTNCGGPPGGDFRQWSHQAWLDALNANMLAPIHLMRAVVDPMIARRFGRIVNITSHAVKSPLAFLGLSNGARAGLTGFVAGLARQVARYNVTINNLLPGLHDTDRKLSAMEPLAKTQGISVDEAIRRYLEGVPARRIGEPAEFGDACAFLCGAQAGYIVGANLSVDGGAYSGLLG